MSSEARLLDRDGLDRLLEALAAQGRQILGPTIRDGAIVYDEITSTDDLPVGWTDEQEGGTYRLRRRDDEALFGYNVGPQSWKRVALPPAVRLWRARQDADGALGDFEPEPDVPQRYAFVGVRSCDLSAMGILDRVLLGSARPDAADRARREDTFVVAVNCAEAGGTCFCVSMGTGPRAQRGFDLALTELIGQGRHSFLVEVGSDRGAALVAGLGLAAAAGADVAEATRASERCAAQMGRHMDTDGIRDLLMSNLEHPRWDEVSDRCLTCGNCTMVCPTCFCTSVEDVTDVTGDHVERWQRWDSCFTIDYSHVHGGSVRSSSRSRYRQWMTHKLATWHDQFDSSGCVGCGRCITWCPVGIDITEEVAAIRETEGERAAH